MDFFDNVMNKSNAIIKDRLNNPFGQKQQSQEQPSGEQQDAASGTAAAAASAAGASDNGGASPAPGSGQEPGAEDKNSQFAAIAADAEAVAQKAAKGAQKFGTFLFSMANKAGQTVGQTVSQTVSQTASKVKQAVESSSILSEFTREQQEFIREHGGSMQAGHLPWSSPADSTTAGGQAGEAAGGEEEQQVGQQRAAYVREQVLLLSQDRRNFVRNPPPSAQYKFDAQRLYPVALALLKEDPNLSKMRYELVPKLVSEDTFWCNYFYRVEMIKQEGFSGGGGAGPNQLQLASKQGWASSRSSSGEGPDEAGAAGLSSACDEPLSSAYNATGQQLASSRQHTLEQQPSFGAPPAPDDAQQPELDGEPGRLVAQADDLKNRLRELNICSFEQDG